MHSNLVRGATTGMFGFLFQFTNRPLRGTFRNLGRRPSDIDPHSAHAFAFPVIKATKYDLGPAIAWLNDTMFFFRSPLPVHAFAQKCAELNLTVET
jgi:hypothetical protein